MCLCHFVQVKASFDYNKRIVQRYTSIPYRYKILVQIKKNSTRVRKKRYFILL